MELFHLRYFVAVAEQLSFSGAARRLHMAASPLSRRVRDLEHELGAALFERDSHHVRLTEAGTTLLPIARDILARADDIPWRLSRVSAGGRDVVLVGVPPGLHESLREGLRTLERRLAGWYDLRRWPGGSEDLARAVARGELAAAFVRLPVRGPEAAALEVLEVLAEPLGAVLPAAEFGSRTSVSLAELRDHAYVVAAPGLAPAYFDRLDRELSEAGVKQRVRLKTGDYTGTGEIVAQGSAFSVSILGERTAMRRYRHEDTVLLPFSDFDPSLVTGLVWRADRYAADPALRRLVARAKEMTGLGEPLRNRRVIRFPKAPPAA
ncbi:LysR family transcriptional regulator [Streptosporangium sandarakinum]